MFLHSFLTCPGGGGWVGGRLCKMKLRLTLSSSAWQKEKNDEMKKVFG